MTNCNLKIYINANNNSIDTFLNVLMISLTAFSCAKTAGESQVQNVSEPTGWSKIKDKKVCFAEGKLTNSLYMDIFSANKATEDSSPIPFSDAEKIAIREGVTKSYNSKTVGLNFTLWETCPSVSTAVQLQEKGFDLAFFRQNTTKSTGGAASQFGQSKYENIITTTSVNEPPSSKLVFSREDQQRTQGTLLGLEEICRTIATDRLNCFAAAAAHEVGHLLGLRHSHAHPEAKNDPVCSLDFSDGASLGKPHPFTDEQLSTTSRIYPYDPHSIMGYCHFFAYLRGDSRSGISAPYASAGDLAAIRDMLVK